jgi:hypothetical protein
MPPKPILVAARLRRPPATGWSWVDRRFVREHMADLSREAVLLYFFLAAVADKHGLSLTAMGNDSIEGFSAAEADPASRSPVAASRSRTPRTKSAKPRRVQRMFAIEWDRSGNQRQF